MSKKDISSFVSVLLIVAIAVAAALTMYTWTTSTVTKQAPVVTIHPKIYSPNHNIGVLNEVAVFNVTVENRANTDKRLRLIISGGGFTFKNETFVVKAANTTTYSIKFKLLYPGTWTVKVTDTRGNILEGYSSVSYTHLTLPTN